MKKHNHSKIAKIVSSIFIGGILAFTMSLPSPAYAAGTEDYLGGQQAIAYPNDIQSSMPMLPARSWAIVDASGNEILSHSGTEAMKIASVTKIMTAIIASKYSMDTQITVSEYAASIPGSSANLEAGDVITLGELLEGLMLPSGNDAAYAIAEGVGTLLLAGDGRQDAMSAPSQDKIMRFVDEMNREGERLGLRNSFFANPCGLDDEGFEGGHHSCATDVALMTKAAMESPVVAAISDSSESNMEVVRKGEKIQIHFVNTDDLLNIRVEEAAGTKTGFTDQAGNCFAGTAIIDGDVYYTSVLGCENRDEMFWSTAQLWDWVRNAKRNIDYMGTYQKLDDGSYLIAELAALEWNDKTFKAVVREDRGGVRWYWEGDVTLSFESHTPEGAIHKDDVVGELSIQDPQGNVIEKIDVVADEDVESPGWWDAIVIFFTRLFAPLTGATTTAWDKVYDGRPVETGNHYSPQMFPIDLPTSMQPAA